MYSWWECKLVWPLWKTVWRFLKKLKIKLPYDLAILLLCICPKETKFYLEKNICIPMFIATFYNSQDMESTKVSIMVGWIKKIQGVCVYIHIHNGILLHRKKRMKSCLLQQHGWTLRALCEVK